MYIYEGVILVDIVSLSALANTVLYLGCVDVQIKTILIIVIPAWMGPQWRPMLDR